MEKIEKYLDKFSLLAIITLSFFAMKALSVPGFYGASDDLHIAWLSQMDKIIKEGQFPPRFVPDLSYGFGYPLFNFVFPLPFYIAEVFHLLGSSLVGSIKLLFALSLPISGYFMYKLVREFGSTFAALTSSVIYIYTPYRSTDIYIRGAIGEITAFIFLPLIVFAIIKILKGGKRKWIGILGMSIAALILSHNIMAYMFIGSVFLLVFLSAVFFLKTSPFYFFRIFLGVVLGFLISIYFWLPAILESAIMKYDTVFDVKDHFPTIAQLFKPYFGWGASVAGPYDGMSFFIGHLNIMLVILGISAGAFWIRKNYAFKKAITPSLRGLVVFWCLVIFVLSIFMMNHRSLIVWEKIPLLPYFQFPWRFLSLTTFATSLAILAIPKMRYQNIVFIAFILITILINQDFFKPHDFLGRTDEYYLNRYIPYPKVSEEYKEIQEEYLRLPQATQMRPDSLFPRFKIEDAEAINVKYPNSLDAKFDVISEGTARVNYYKYLFPGWTVYVNGFETPTRAGKPLGHIVFDVPRGISKVEIVFKETDFRIFLNIISLLSFFCAVTIVLTDLHVRKN